MWWDMAKKCSNQNFARVTVLGRVAPNPVKIKSYETTVFFKLEPEPKVL